MNSKFFSARNVALLGILVALVVVLQLFASAIPMFGVTLNFSLIPIALASMVIGTLGGTIVGFVCGLVVFITTAVLGGEPTTAYFFQVNPIILTLMCIGKTTCAGFVSGLLYKFINRQGDKKRTVIAVVASSFVIPVINTAIYMLGIILMKGAVVELLGLTSTGVGAVFVAVFVLIWLNFLLEIAITAVFTPPIYRVLKIVDKKVGFIPKEITEENDEDNTEEKGGQE